MDDPSPSPHRTGLLFADGERAVCEMVRVGLGGSGFSVWPAADGSEAIELYRLHASSISAVLLEVELPGRLDGPQTLACLRALSPDLPCCFMTAGIDRYTEAELLALGGAPLFRKPFRLADVARALYQVTGGLGRRRDAREGSLLGPVRVAGGQGYLRDRSPNGLGLWLPEPAAVGEVLTVRFDPASVPAAQAQAEVRHCRPDGSGWVLGCRLVATM